MSATTTTVRTGVMPGATRTSRQQAQAVLASAAMIAAPLLLALAEVISPVDTSGDDSAERVANILAHPTRFNLTQLALLGGMMLLIPAVLTLRSLAMRRGDAWAWVGAVIAVAGLILFCVNIGAMGIGPSAWPAVPASERDGLVAVSRAMDDLNGVLPLTIPGVFLPLIGLALLAAGLWKDRSLPRWCLALLPLGWAVFLMGPTPSSRVAGDLLLLAALAGAVVYLHRPAAPKPSASP